MKNILGLLAITTVIITFADNQQYNNTENIITQANTIVSEVATEKIDNSDISNIKINNKSNPNAPILMTGMTGVFWDSNVNEQIVTAENIDGWYNYALQVGTEDGNSKWANAKTEDGSYWVWIPRYEYKINQTDKTIDINFIPTTKTIPTDNYIIHPAFEDGSVSGKNNNYVNGEWDNELSGFWVAKYEMSNNSGVPASVSGVTSWRNISIEDSYIKSQSIKNEISGLNSDETDSHLMKNSEWGAVAYLSHSPYGRNGTEIMLNSNNSYMTAGDEGATALTNKNQSTTGNETGVFDMAGGTWERVASYMTNGHNNLTKNASSIPNIVTNRDKIGYLTKSNKYLTVYPFNLNDNDIAKNYSEYKNLSTKLYGYGDAILETSTNGNGSSSWNNDMSNYLFTDDLLFLRGGIYFNGDSAGVFAFNSAGGGADSHLGFRVVLVGE